MKLVLMKMDVERHSIAKDKIPDMIICEEIKTISA